MNLIVTDIPFAVEEKTLSLIEILERYLVFLQDRENLQEIKEDQEKKEKTYSLEDIRKLYVWTKI